MNISIKKRQRRRSAGFTLVEISLAVLLSLGIAGTLLGFLQQHAVFLRLIEQGRFIKEEVPIINLTVGRFVQQADSYLLFASKTDAQKESNAVNTGASALLLQFRDPDGTMTMSLIAFESLPAGKRLNMYAHDGNAWASDPSWMITTAPEMIAFSNDSGILRTTITGPHGEEITYGGHSQ